MQDTLVNTLKTLSIKIQSRLPNDFEKSYYSKMSYSGINKILQKEKNLLRDTISIEIALSHFVVYQLSRIFNYENYRCLMKKFDLEDYFCWYDIDDDTKLDFEQFAEYDLISLCVLLQEHDTLIDKNIKKELGQFYTPVDIVKQMISELVYDIKLLDNTDKIVDPAVGTGVLIVELLNKIIDCNKSIDIMSFVDNNIFAFDVNPFAVFATKINIIINLCNKLGCDTVIYSMENEKYLLKNIKIENSITNNQSEKYSIVISNPPYFKLDNDMLSKVKGYESITYGQPNIYSLFVYWGLSNLKENGRMSYIIPQSIKSGLYFKNLRKELSKYVISSIICIDSRQRIFDRAEQAVLILNVNKKKKTNDKTKIQFLNCDKNKKTTFKINSNRILLDDSRNYMFMINKSLEEYEIIDKIYKNGYKLNSEDSDYKFSNGLFVWNQHKDTLSDNSANVYIIYGANIQPRNFINYVNWSNKEKKRYSKPDKSTTAFLHKGKKLLVQRTTNYEKNIRIKSCLIPDDFLENNNEYFIENHVNYLTTKDNGVNISSDKLYYFLGVLNSTLFNKLFVSVSGNTQVSAGELNLIPFPQDDNTISTYMQESTKKDEFNQNELDELVFKAYGISEEEFEILCQ